MRPVSSDTIRQLARLDLSPEWDVRLVDQDNRVLTIPPGALKGRQRGSELDGSTWRLSLSLDRSLLPYGTDPKQYHEIEMDLLLGSDVIPYFRGIIDHPQGGESLQGGAITEPLELECFGNLQKLKGHRIGSFRPTLSTAQNSGQYLLGVCSTQRQSVSTAISSGSSERLPQGAVTFGANNSSHFTIYTDATLATAYTYGVHYTVDTSAVPLKITWNTTGAAGRVIQWYQVDRFIYPVAPGPIPFFPMPYGRTANDLYQTTIDDLDTSVPGAVQVKVADKAGWVDKIAIPSFEYMGITKTDGTSAYYQLSSVAADGWVTLAGIPSMSGVAIGQPCRLSTVEGHQAWDDNKWIRFFRVNSPLGSEWERRYLTALPNLGIATSGSYNWPDDAVVYTDAFYVRQDSDTNRMEEVIKTFLTSTGIFASSDITTDKTGAYAKNFTLFDMTADDVVAELAKNVPPNAFIHDEPDGTISIKPYQQIVEPDWVMRGAHEIQESDFPEPIGAVTVIAEDDQPTNYAPLWHKSNSNLTNPERVIDNSDGQDATSSTPASTTQPVSVTFRIPLPSPETAFPNIEKVQIVGRGTLNVYVTSSSGTSRYVPGWTSKAIGTDKSQSVEVPKEDLYRALLDDSAYYDLTVELYPVTKGPGIYDTSWSLETAPALAEVRILSKQSGAHKAEITDDTSKATADNGVNAFGSLWTQIDATKQESWRYATPSDLKRTSTKYVAPGAGANKPRHKILRLKGISQQAARDYAEKWLDYKLMEGKSYTVSGILDPRAQLGDTVRIFRKNGSYLDLFLWSISDGGTGLSGCTYTFRDYR